MLTEKTILSLGGTGSLGKVLVRRLLTSELGVSSKIIVFSRDEAYISAKKAAYLWQKNLIQLRTIPRRKQRKQLSLFLQQLHNSIRQMVETVNEQLSNQFNIEVNHAHTFWGLYTQLYTNLAPYTLASTSIVYSGSLISCKSRAGFPGLALDPSNNYYLKWPVE